METQRKMRAEIFRKKEIKRRAVLRAKERAGETGADAVDVDAIVKEIEDEIKEEEAKKETERREKVVEAENAKRESRELMERREERFGISYSRPRRSPPR